MIQRIQSVLLAIASMLSVAGVFMPAWKYVYNGETETVWGMEVRTAAEAHVRHYNFWDNHNYAHLVWFVLSLVISLFLLTVIFFYKKRLLQILLCQIGMILIIAQIAALMFLTFKGPYMALGGANAASTPSFGFVVPILSLILTWFATKKIKDDEKLVRSVDRLR